MWQVLRAALQPISSLPRFMGTTCAIETLMRAHSAAAVALDMKGVLGRSASRQALSPWSHSSSETFMR